jgi:hypothetical protein
MTKDPIVEEIHRLRAEEMKRHNFDSEAYFRDLKEAERLSPNPLLAPPEPGRPRDPKRARFVRR